MLGDSTEYCYIVVINNNIITGVTFYGFDHNKSYGNHDPIQY